MLHIYKHKMSRSEIPRRIILYIMSTWLINVLLQIAPVVMRLLRKSHLSFGILYKADPDLDPDLQKKQSPDQNSLYELKTHL